MEELLEKFNKLKKEEKWIEAAEVEMIFLDEYPNAEFYTVKWRVNYTEEQRKELEKRGEEDRKVAFWVGMLKYVGCGGYEQDLEGAYEWISKAAAVGHVTAMYWKGTLLCNGFGVTRDREAALKCYEEAGAAGHEWACYFVGCRYEDEKRYFQAALWYQRQATFHTNHTSSIIRLKANYSEEICPWGEWRPDREYHSLVPPKVQEAVKTTLLLFKRLGITRYLAWQVCAYVVTQSGWE